MTVRTIALWCPDWPVAARLAADGAEAVESPGSAIALIDRGLVFACSAEARAQGVRRGLRVREAQARCPGLIVHAYDPVLDARMFEPVLQAVEALVPGVQVLRPGSCLLRARGPVRYYGGEEEAAAALLECVRGQGVPAARVGIADGPFAAEQAARTAPPETPVRVVVPGGSPDFLSPFPVSVLDDPRLATLLRRLGIPTLGAFARLDPLDVLARFGEGGARAHLRAGGRDDRRIVPRTPPEQLDVAVEFEPPLDRIDQIAFAMRAAADRFLARLREAGLVCTELGIGIDTEAGEHTERSWLHPRWFSEADVVDRIRWQLGGSAADGGLSAGITRVHLIPERVDGASAHEAGLWGGGPDESIHHALSRLQGMLGHEGVLTPAIGGGRMLLERAVLVPWGDRRPETSARAADGAPWPGSLPAPAPSRVFPDPVPVAVRGADREQVGVDPRGRLTAEPVRLDTPGGERSVTAWAGPWAVEQRWWDPESVRELVRLQLVAGDEGWLVIRESGRWWAEAVYE